MPLLEADDTDGGSRSHTEMAAARLASYSSVELYPTAKPITAGSSLRRRRGREPSG